MSVITFNNEQHPLSKRSKELYDKLVPVSGASDSLQGELLRASSTINCDWFNNGWGCNNWSGAVRFIEANYTKLPDMPDQMFIEQLMKELDFVSNYSHGEPHNFEYDGRVCMTVTKIHEMEVNAIVANPHLIKNTDDMYDYKEKDYQYPREEYEEEEL